jgi:hypothetical protein
VADAAQVLLALALHLLLTALPIAASMLLAACLGLRRPPLLLAVGLAASGLAAMAAFWLFYLDPLLGRSFSYLVPLGSLLLVVACLRSGRVDRDLVKELAVPLALWGLGSAFILYLGFLHGGTSEPLALATNRFYIGLPSDNVIPSWFADWFFQHGHEGTPPVFPGDWLASDRPPLQVGYLLSQRGFGWDSTGLRAEVVGVVLQQLWILGLWALLLAARVGRTARGLTVLVALVSPLVIVNGFFVWPKLLPAALLLAAAALLLAPSWPELRREPRAAALLAALVALALLGHGASVFGIVPLLLLAALRGFPGGRWLGVAVLVGALLLAPWAAYQKFAEPPGNRLTKWMLAGVEGIDERGTVETIADSYGEAGFGGAVDNKWTNLEAIAGGSPALERLEAAVTNVGDGNWEGTASELRSLFFFQLLPSLGLLLLAPLAMAIARLRGPPQGPEWSFSLLCWAAFVCGCLVWALLMFGGPQSNASVHVGSLMLPLLAIAAATVGLCAVLPRFAPFYLSAWVLLTLAIYAPSLAPPPGSAYSAAAALLAIAALGGFALLSFRGAAGSATANTLAR